uniref:Dynamin N-terminal domain-containing protein n=1 Tax=Attheya septentrionalis TaxID=420275 RepID=A0A7S2UGA6_9STRA
MPLNDQWRGPLAKHSDRGTSLPFVFLVGNHSSGKSSFVNYVLGRKVQTAGVAPTDDSFTVIAPGPEDTDQDGPALIGDPDMGFSNLRQFGPTLIHHTQLKVRSGINNGNFMMVDSPGMIDSPVSSGGFSGQTNTTDRGYDFQGVVRWFAERADVVLLFFDPDKPGTTGETLSILLHSLGGMDHKLLIVLNKADQFEKIHDFARAYGSLCWNLSKVIPRKDLPRIYTMCLPVKGGDTAQKEIMQGLADLHQTRDDVVAEVMKAPKRRIDNVITHLNDSVHLLMMHALISEDVRKRYSKVVWDHRTQEVGTAVAGGGLAALSLYAGIPTEFSFGVFCVTVLGAGGLRWHNSIQLTDAEAQLLTTEELSASFQRTHAREISEADEFTASVWQRIRGPLQMSLQSIGLANIPSVSSSEWAQLNNILDQDIPKLRRLASPTHFGTKKEENP